MNQKPKIDHRGLSAVLGVFLIILGGIAVATPFFVTLEISVLMGVLFIVSGIIQLIHAFQFNSKGNRACRFLVSGLSLVAGFLVLRSPLAGALAITLIMAFYFLAAAVGRGALAFELRKGRGKAWLFFSSAISLLLGVYLISTLSTSSLFVPGIFLGVDFIFYGITLIALGAGLKSEEIMIQPDWPSRAA